MSMEFRNVFLQEQGQKLTDRSKTTTTDLEFDNFTFEDDWLHLMQCLRALSFGQREEAIAELYSSGNLLRAFMRIDVLMQTFARTVFGNEGLEGGMCELNPLFFAKFLEKTLDFSFVEKPTYADPQNPLSLFVMDQYEEAINLLSQEPYSGQREAEALRAFCHAMLGQHEDAFAFFNNQKNLLNLDDIDDRCYWELEEWWVAPTLICLLNGNTAEAKNQFPKEFSSIWSSLLHVLVN